MIEDIFFILHVVNGLFITIHNVKWYNYTNTNTINDINILIFVQKSFNISYICVNTNLLVSRDYNRYNVEILSVN